MAYMGFDALKAKLAQRPGVNNPGALAASIGRKKYGKEKFQKAAAQGASLQNAAPVQQPEMGMNNLNGPMGPVLPSFGKGIQMPSLGAPEHETPGLMKNINGAGMPKQYSPLQHSYSALKAAMRRKY